MSPSQMSLPRWSAIRELYSGPGGGAHFQSHILTPLREKKTSSKQDKIGEIHSTQGLSDYNPYKFISKISLGRDKRAD